MAKHKADREDLIREGTGMPVRGRMLIGQNEIVLGFRQRDVFSLYWNQDPVFQFDEQQQLRRVFYDATRYKSRERRLIRLVQPTDHTNASISRLRFAEENVSAAEEAEILQRLDDCLQQIYEALIASEDVDQTGLECVGMEVGKFRTRVLQWISRLPRPLRIAEQPSA